MGGGRSKNGILYVVGDETPRSRRASNRPRDWLPLWPLILIISAIKELDGNMLFNLSVEAALEPPDTVIVVGELNNLQKLVDILNPHKK